MKKLWLIPIFLCLLTGCSVNYNLTIEDDLKIREEITMTGTNEFFETYNKTSKLNVVKMLLDDYSQGILKENGYNYEIIKDQIPYVKVNKTYDSIENYVQKNIFIKQYFDRLNYSYDGAILKITSGEFYPIDPFDPSRFDIKKFTLAITSKYKVVKHNAEKVSEKSNTYYWEINNDTQEFELLLEVDTSDKFSVWDTIMKELIICLVLIVLTWSLFFYFSKKKKLKGR